MISNLFWIALNLLCVAIWGPSWWVMPNAFFAGGLTTIAIIQFLDARR